jgi:anti-sigma regulatory factor (Ser/Thr protein kinase)
MNYDAKLNSYQNNSLRVVADLKNLATIREFVEQKGRDFGVIEEAIGDMVLAVDEAVSNIILHGYQGKDGQLEVEIIKDANDMIVRLTDDSEPFDPTKIPEPDVSLPLNKRKPGGLGVYLIRKFVDRISHRVLEKGGNELVLIKFDVINKM